MWLPGFQPRPVLGGAALAKDVVRYQLDVLVAAEPNACGQAHETMGLAIVHNAELPSAELAVYLHLVNGLMWRSALSKLNGNSLTSATQHAPSCPERPERMF
jgi:hypothetical protein